MTVHNQNRRSAGFWAELIKSFRLAWRLLRDGRVPFWTKLIPIVVAGYIILPIDLLPDVIPGLGQLDDLTLLILGTQIFIAICPAWIVQWHRNDLDGSSKSAASHEIIDGK
jgi:uncharacterized membrane protein YkvA (DUF1232 family)